MKQEDQQDALALELDMLISRWIDEFDLTVASVIGILEVKKMDLFIEHREMCGEEEE